jgi:hypothetical protein
VVALVDSNVCSVTFFHSKKVLEYTISSLWILPIILWAGYIPMNHHD